MKFHRKFVTNNVHFADHSLLIISKSCTHFKECKKPEFSIFFYRISLYGLKCNRFVVGLKLRSISLPCLIFNNQFCFLKCFFLCLVLY